jgi:hypothetical protein
MQQYSYGNFGLIYLGALGKNENGSPFINYLCQGTGLPIPGVTVYIPPASAGQPFKSAALQGVWQFSNNGSTVELTWGGKTS